MELFKKTVLFASLFALLHYILRLSKEKDLLMIYGKGDFINDNISNDKKSFSHFIPFESRILMTQYNASSVTNDANNFTIDYDYQNSYYFLNNISSYQYYGLWNNSIPTRNFHYNSGNLIVSITKNNTSIRNFIENIENYEVLYISILFYDGFYIDHWMNFSFNIHLEENFSAQFKELRESITIENEVTISKVVGEFNDQINFTSNKQIIQLAKIQKSHFNLSENLK